MTGDKKIFLLAQKNSEVENPNKNDLYRCGTIAKILQLLKLPDGTIKVLVEGIERANLKNLNLHKEFTSANVVKIEKKIKITNNIKALCKIVVEQFDEYSKLNKKIPTDINNNLKALSEPNKLADLVSVNLNISLEQKQELLEIINIETRLDKIYTYLVSEIDSFQVEKKLKVE
jgi:ATP-dependent Lon protease